MDKKTCKICGKEYIPTGYYQKYCSKECFYKGQKEHKRQYRIEHKEQEIERTEKWREKNPEKRNLIARKCHHKHRGLGHILLNEPFEGCREHHINQMCIICIPKEIHESISHNVWTGKNMNEINELAIKYFEVAVKSTEVDRLT